MALIQDVLDYDIERGKLENQFQQQRTEYEGYYASRHKEMEELIDELQAKLNQHRAGGIDEQEAKKLLKLIHEQSLEDLRLEFDCEEKILAKKYVKEYGVLQLNLCAGIVSTDDKPAQMRVLELDRKKERQDLELRKKNKLQDLELKYKTEQWDLELKKNLEDLRMRFECQEKVVEQKYVDAHAKLEIKFLAKSIYVDFYQAQTQKLLLDEEKEKQDLEKEKKKERQKLEARKEKLVLEEERKRTGQVAPAVHGTATVPSNPDISKFIQRLSEMDIHEEDKVLDLQGGTLLAGDANLGFLNGKLLIRDCYKKLRDIIFSEIADDPYDSKQKRKFVIQGNPGIGKSLFSYFMIYTLMKKNKTIIWEPMEKDMRVCIKGSSSQFTEGHKGFVEELNDTSSWYIVDGHPPKLVNAYTLLVCSPVKDHWRDAEKMSALMLYMPVWSRSELVTAHGLGLARIGPEKNHQKDPSGHGDEKNHQENPTDHPQEADCQKGSNVTLATIDALFAKCGGIPRYVFQHSNNDPVAKLELAIEKAKIKDLDSVVRMNVESNDISHRVIHIKVVKEEVMEGGKLLRPFRNHRIDFASKYVGLKVTKRLVNEKKAKMMTFIKTCMGLPHAKGFGGIMYEQVAHTKISAGGTFRIRKLQANALENDGVSQNDGQSKDVQVKDAVTDPSSHEKIDFLKTKLEKFNELKDVTSNSDVYWVPEAANFESIDSLMLPNSLFQMTISEVHPVKMQGLKVAVERLKVLNAMGAVPSPQAQVSPAKRPRPDDNAQEAVRLYFVVPPKIFESFPWQSYLTQENKKATLIPRAVQAVEQYAMEVCIFTSSPSRVRVECDQVSE